MNDPIFLTVEEVLQLHAEALELFGGAAGIRDRGAIESAVQTPQQTFGGEYLHPDLPSMAAAYLSHLTKNHGFIDGNKRIGARAAAVFLGMNGCDVHFPIDEAEQLVLGVAKGEVSKDAVTEFIRKLCDAE
jgi:death-on-curing protein